jgi:hypothetical protein
MNGDFEAKFFDESGTPYRGVPVEDLLVKGATVTGLLECTGVWFAGGRFGLSWKVKQMIIHHLPQKMKDFAFVGFSGVAAGAPPSRQAVTDVEADDDEVFQGGAAAATAVAVAPRAVGRVLPSAVAAVLPPVQASAEDNEEDVVVPAAATAAAPSAGNMDADAEDMEPVPVPTRKPIIKKKVVTTSVKK